MSDHAEELNSQNSDPGPGAEAETPPRKEDEISLDSMSKEQLLARAEKAGVKVKSTMNKAEIIQAIIDAEGGAISDNQNEESPGAEAETPPSDKKDLSKDKGHTAEADDAEIGTVRIREGVESVKIGPGKWIPTVRENIPPGKPVVIISEKRAGKTIIAVTGIPITFDENGRATVKAEDGHYLKDLPGFSLEKGND
ncbi:MAG: hypothetical protein LBF78_06880 [Treponema sp.]|jgi:hypothetical protein|nr:hypothetical protein [Treponema sp.]